MCGAPISQDAPASSPIKREGASKPETSPNPLQSYTSEFLDEQEVNGAPEADDESIDLDHFDDDLEDDLGDDLDDDFNDDLDYDLDQASAEAENFEAFQAQAENLDLKDLDTSSVEVQEEEVESSRKSQQTDRQATAGPIAEHLKQKASLEIESPRDQLGKLLGWLVILDGQNNQSVEIRVGKFLLTQKQLRQNDLVIDHPSISIPHAMFVCSEEGIHVQDLLSSHGTYITRGNAKEKKIDDQFELKTRDKIRFGQVETLLILI
jgi:pSer/pThr/pTyr-binding forkhead associated (FHA) protein